MINKEILTTTNIVNDISDELTLPAGQVEPTLRLILDDSTVPFIARYRKEVTGGLDEVQIRDIRDKYEYLAALYERKETILKSIEEQGKLTPELRAKILQTKVKTQLEDIYLPYKPKKRTRGQIARERGLEPLALRIFDQGDTTLDLPALFLAAVGTHDELKTLEVVVQGVKDYIAELISEDADTRGELRTWIFENGSFTSVVKDEFKEAKTKFGNYYDFKEAVRSIAPHRLMALRRGEKESVLKVNLEYDQDVAISIVRDRMLKSSTTDGPIRVFLIECITDSFVRLLSSSIETELRLETKTSAEEEAIKVFAKNLRNLLLLPPIPKKIVLGIDPGLRTGSKLVVVDQTGKLLEHTTIFPNHDEPALSSRNANALNKVVELIKKFSVQYVSIGNGTAGREMDEFLHQVLEANKDLAVRIVVVNEAGASVYSASDVAREEFPDLDLTYRGSVSIARRLQDPLAELVKIDPKSIGVGQYQHDVNQSKLKKSLEEVVSSCVNFVGVNLNTASPSLLSYVAGIGPSLSKQIVRHREQKGEFSEREKLFEVMGFGAKAFEQSAGFLRIMDGTNVLDKTGVHPESYAVVRKMADDSGLAIEKLIGNKDVLNSLDLTKYTNAEIGIPTLQDIVKDLLKPGRDPRDEGSKHVFNRDLKNFDSLKEGQILLGTVTNVTNFGAFVDIGVHQDGLIHVSELSSQFIKDAANAISVGDQVKVMVIGVDKERKRISLSRKAVETGVIPGTTDGRSSASTAPTMTRVNSPRPAQGFGPASSGSKTADSRHSAQGTQNGFRNQDRHGESKNRGASGSSRNAHDDRPSASSTSKQRDSVKENTSGPASVADLLAKFNTRRV